MTTVQQKEKVSRKYLLLPVIVVALVLASSLALYLFSQTSPINALQASNAAVLSQGEGYPVPAASVEHGEDSVITFADSGVESRVRLYLDRPEGDILHSDVWELRYVDISTARIVFLEQPTSGDSFYLYAGGDSYVSENQIATDSFLPAICSLEDFRWFDSLQVLQINMQRVAGAWEPLTQLSGLENCRNLSVLRLDNVTPESLDALGALNGLTVLSLQYYGENALEVEALAELTELEVLYLSNVGFTDPTPIARLSNLKSLYLNACRQAPDSEEEWKALLPGLEEVTVT